MIVGEPTALLATVILPVMLPTPVGLHATVKVALVPGAKLTGVLIPETATLATDGVTLEIVTWEVPKFVRRTVCVVALPTTTFPKLKDEGVAASVEDVAVAPRLIARVGLAALLEMETVPASVPEEVGLYVTVRLAIWPAVSVTGAVNPDTPTPVPDHPMFEIVAVWLPEFVRCTV